MQSGVCVDSVYPSLHAAEASGEKLAKDLGVASGPAALQALRGIASEKILAAVAADDAIDLEPNVDGRVLPQQPAVTFARGGEARVPVLAGSNEDEISIFASPMVGGRSYRPKTVAEYRAWLERKFGTNADEVFAAYPAHSNGEVGGVFVRMDTDFDFGFGAWLLAKDTAQVGRNAFLYHFTYVGNGAFAGLGAFHSEENMFLSQRYWTSWVADPNDAILSRILTSYWAGEGSARGAMGNFSEVSDGAATKICELIQTRGALGAGRSGRGSGLGSDPRDSRIAIGCGIF
jgi:para-nitrobenzyl esterase